MLTRATRRASLLVAGTIALFGGAPLHTASAQDDLYSVVDLGTVFSEQISLARSVNVHGQVAGRTGAVNGSDTRAAVWSLGGLEILGTLPGGDYSGAYGINDSKIVVGSSNTGTTVRPFIWTSGEGMRPLPSLPGDPGGEALAINNAGDVVGYSTGPAGAVAVLWTADGQVVRIGTLPGGNSSRAVAINEAGQVAGWSRTAAGKRAFVWSARDGLRALGTLPGDTESEPLDINDSGHVVGASIGRSNTTAFLWTPANGMVRLKTLDGGRYSRAIGINNKGQIVGTSTSAQGTRAVIWSYTGEVRALYLLARPAVFGMIVSEAQAINDAGEIVALSGGGEHADDKEHTDHFYHVYMLKR